MVKIDLHTHSIASPDGSITADQYRHVLLSGVLDGVAITDHNRIDFALDIHKQLGPRIIVGEEIMTPAGEIIGLFLKKPIEPGQTPLETVKQIKEQGGLVYIPHPFETVRKGLSDKSLEKIVKHVDIVEVFNGRALFQNRGSKAAAWAEQNRKPGAGSSDAHGIRGLGSTYTEVPDTPNRKNLTGLLENAEIIKKRPRPKAVLYPKYNRLRKRFGRTVWAKP